MRFGRRSHPSSIAATLSAEPPSLAFRRRRVAALGIALVALIAFSPRWASADELLPAQARDVRATFPLMRLVGGHGGGGGGRTLQVMGPYLGVDGGFAVMLASRGTEARDALGFGVHAGYRFPTGLAIDVRGDDLGVTPDGHGGPLLAAGAGLRFTLPALVMPFADAHVGTALAASQAVFAADAGLGLELPIVRHFAVELGARDWIADIDGTVRHVPFLTVGFVFGFEGSH
jgi:hypothetical protein